MALVIKDGNGVAQNLPNYDPGYRYAVLGITPAATPTDVLVIQGAAGIVTRIKSIKLNGVATANGNMPMQLIRRSAANTGGTSTAPVPGKADTNDAAPASVLTQYSANPASLGAAVQTLAGSRLNFATTATGSVVANQGWDFAVRMEKPITLRGASDFLAINLAGAAVPAGGLLDLEVAFEEGSA